jgi:copper transport protein
VIGALDTVFRFGAYAGTVVLLGAAYIVCLLWTEGVRHRGARRVLVGSWLVATVSTAGLLPSATVGTTVGKLLLLRLLVLAVAALLWWRIRRTDVPLGRWDSAGLALLVVESFSFAGHAGQGSLVALAATVDALHLAAASVWLGGMTVVAVALSRSSGVAEGTAERGALVARWSRTAMVAVAVLVLTGAYQAWREIGSVSAALGTPYGRLFLAKMVAVVLSLTLADYARRRWLHRDRPARAWSLAGSAAVSAPRPAIARTRRLVAAEAALGMVVLALTAGLTAAVPAARSYSPALDITVDGQSAQFSAVRMHVVISPTSYGFEDMRVEVSDPGAGRLSVQSVTGSLMEHQLRIGPINFSFHPADSGAVVATAVDVPAPGDWHLQLVVRTDSAHQYSASIYYRVR